MDGEAGDSDCAPPTRGSAAAHLRVGAAETPCSRVPGPEDRSTATAGDDSVTFVGMIVCKFGGTSVADREAQERLVRIVRDRLPARPLVVVSALSGVSDALIGILADAVAGAETESATALQALAGRHRLLLEATPAPGDVAEECRAALEDTLGSLESLRRGIVLLNDASPWIRTRFIAAGELLSSRIVVAAFAAAGIEAVWLDARNVVRTGGLEPECDSPVPAEISRLAAAEVTPRLAPGGAVVTQGFIGSDASGRTTLLGRGGSDYSASLLGAALGAERIEIWTDVDGVLTANPKIVPEARRLRGLSFAEASELAYFGARVLHPSTILPAIEAEVPVWVGNARRPEGGGTTIVARATPPADERSVVKAIADKRGIAVVNVTSTRMLMAHGFLARIFEVFDLHRTPVDLVATSEVSVSLTVDDDSRLSEIVAALSRFSSVEVERDMALVCLVGEGMRGRAGIAATVFRAIRFSPVRMITQGASAINLSLVVRAEDADRVVVALHEAFFGGPLPAEVFGEAFRDLEELGRLETAAHSRPGTAGQALPLPLAELARRHGTPLYVYDLDAIGARARQVADLLGGAGRRLFYACKANAHPKVLAQVSAAGFGVEAASPGEAELALDCGLPPNEVLLSASNARPRDLATALERGMFVTLGALSDIRRVGVLAPGHDVLLRLNPGVGDGHHPHVITGGAHSKFGIPLEELAAAVEAAAEAGLVVRGLHAHIGSGIAGTEPLLLSARRLLEAAAEIPTVRVLDLGGGFAIPYREGDRELDLAAYAAGLETLLAEFETRLLARPELWFEPGRYVVGPAGYLVAEVTCRKESGGLTFIGLDTGMNHLLRPALYGACHRVVNLSAPEAPLEWVEVVGNVCETTDVLASNRPVPRPEEGHLLAFLDVGAYGYSMASRYNLWPLPKEVALSAGCEQS